MQPGPRNGKIDLVLLDLIASGLGRIACCRHLRRSDFLDTDFYGE